MNRPSKSLAFYDKGGKGRLGHLFYGAILGTSYVWLKSRGAGCQTGLYKPRANLGRTLDGGLVASVLRTDKEAALRAAATTIRDLPVAGN